MIVESGEKVSLFVTCLVDSLFPDIGVSIVKVLRHVAIKVDFPENQRCYGQPAFNSGYCKEDLEVNFLMPKQKIIFNTK